MKLGLFAVPMLFALSGCGGTVIPENDGPVARIMPNKSQIETGDFVRLELINFGFLEGPNQPIPMQIVWHQPDRGTLQTFFNSVIFNAPAEPGPVKFKVEIRNTMRGTYVHEETLEVVARQ